MSYAAGPLQAARAHERPIINDNQLPYVSRKQIKWRIWILPNNRYQCCNTESLDFWQTVFFDRWITNWQRRFDLQNVFEFRNNDENARLSTKNCMATITHLVLSIGHNLSITSKIVCMQESAKTNNLNLMYSYLIFEDSLRFQSTPSSVRPTMWPKLYSSQFRA